MSRLPRYLVRLFSAEAAALFGVALGILFLAQCLRVIDAGSVRTQGIGSLLVQAVLALPPVGIAFFYVCVAMGLARGLRQLQASRELHILHVGQRLRGLFAGIGAFIVLGVVLVQILAHVVEPAASREGDVIRARNTADLVSRTLQPNRFARVTQGVTITVGGRGRNGEITSFFADDRRDPTRRTYIAQSALISIDEQGYVLQLRDGTVQYRTSEGKFSEIAFTRYDMPLERLTGSTDGGEVGGDRSSYGIVMAALADGDWTEQRLRTLAERSSEGMRVITLCLLVAGMAAFPSGRRREPRLPIEITVLGIAFLERGINSYGPNIGWMSPLFSTLLLGGIALIILAVRLRYRLLPVPVRAVRP